MPGVHYEHGSIELRTMLPHHMFFVNAKVFSHLVNLEELEVLPDKQQSQFAADQRRNLEQLSILIQRLKPIDRQVIISYLEGMDAVSIGKITGLSPGNVSMKVTRIKSILRSFYEGGKHAR